METLQILYHGTSERRAQSIFAEGVLRRAPIGVQVVSTTLSLDVARYFARGAAHQDVDEFGDAGRWCVLAVPADKVNATPFSDPIWGDHECDWEQEMAIDHDVPASIVWRVESGQLSADFLRRYA